MSLFDFLNREQDERTFPVYVVSDRGKVRLVNEDNFFAEKLGIRESENCELHYGADKSLNNVFAVFDGMGGESFGDESSRISAETVSHFARLIKNADESQFGDIVNQYINDANEKVCDMIFERGGGRGGSTAAIVCTCGENAYAYNVGDSRIYYLTEEKFVRVTTDQTLAMKKVMLNIYTEEEARNSPDSHKLTSFIGADDRGAGMKALSYRRLDMKSGVILICSDGLTDMCSDEEIEDVLRTWEGNPARNLVRRAIQNGGADNVTCIVIDYTGMLSL